MEPVVTIPSEVINFVKFTAIGGFITASTLVINLNFKAYNALFRERTKLFWFFFFLLTVLPLLMVIYIFTLFFG